MPSGLALMLRKPKYRIFNTRTKQMIPWEGIAFAKDRVRTCMAPVPGVEGPHYHLIDIFEEIMATGGVCLESAGVPDKNGKEIFVGDILKIVREEKEYIGIMRWYPSEMRYGITVEIPVALAPESGKIIHETKDEGRPEIIGNIFEHPHLIPTT